MILTSCGVEPGLVSGPVLGPSGESGVSSDEAELGAESRAEPVQISRASVVNIHAAHRYHRVLTLS